MTVSVCPPLTIIAVLSRCVAKNTLTLTDFKVFKCQLWARVVQQNFSIQREQHGALVQIHHAANHITRLPHSAKVFIALVPALNLGGGRELFSSAPLGQNRGTHEEVYSPTLKPSKTKAWSSDPSSWSGRHPGRAHPTLICPAVSTWARGEGGVSSSFSTLD